MVCGVNGTYPPTIYYPGQPASGFNPTEISGQLGKTYEFTKIIPDGQLTPGAHVEYFYRKSAASNPLTGVETVPDTARVVPQWGEGPNYDGHRWQQFGVLPDRWKDASFGGLGMATMLVIDARDGRGEERAWLSIADAIGLTVPSRRGAHNGWNAGAV